METATEKDLGQSLSIVLQSTQKYLNQKDNLAFIKEGCMMNRWFYPFLAVLMLIVLPLALAGVEEEEFYCDEETLCDDVCDLYEVECVCQDNICVGAGTEDTGAGGSAAETTPASQPPVEGTDTFEESEEVMTEQSSEGTTASKDTTTNLENRVTTVETDVGALKTSVQI